MGDSFLHQLATRGHFLRFEAGELEQHFGTLLPLLPRPRPLHFAERPHEPVWGFPILITPELERAQATLGAYLEAETAAELAVRSAPRPPGDRVEETFASYRRMLLAISENVATASLASDYPQIFWLFHGRDVARYLEPLPAALLALRPELGRCAAAEIKYRVLQRYLDRVMPQLFDQAVELAVEYGERDANMFPPLLLAMRENLLLFSEISVDPALRGLGDYFLGYLHLDADGFLGRLAALRRWHAAQTHLDAAFAGLLPHVPAERRLNEPGYATFLAALPGYDRAGLLAPREVRLWEGLVRRLREFELFDALRRRQVGVRSAPDGDLMRDPIDAQRLGVGAGARLVGSKGIDFMTAWVVDPEVTRGGMIYDIVDFTATLSRLGHTEHQRQDDAFRALFRFQRRLDRIGRDQHLRFEKYLGDGAFYSSRDAASLVRAAIDIQRNYRSAVDRGFAFASGLRIALGFGDYRLMGFGDRGGPERFEVFGQGIVELSRLVSGKTGATAATAPVGVPLARWRPTPQRRAQRPARTRDRELGSFAAWIDDHGVLHNEGIVATARFLQQLAARADFQLERCRGVLAGTLILHLRGAAADYPVGVRRLGCPALKGLDELVVYEVFDAAGGRYDAEAVPPSELVAVLDAAPASELPTRGSP